MEKFKVFSKYIGAGGNYSLEDVQNEVNDFLSKHKIIEVTSNTTGNRDNFIVIYVIRYKD